MKARAAFNKL